MNWNLDTLYESFESLNFLKDFNDLEKKINDYNEFSKNLNNLKIEIILKQEIEIKKLFVKLGGFINLTISTDVKNEKANFHLGKLRDLGSSLVKGSTNFLNFLKNVDPYLNNDFLKEHEYYLKKLKKDSDYLLDSEIELLLANLKSSGSNAWSDLQSLITSTLEIEFEDEIIPLSSLRNKAFSNDSEIRKKAYKIELKSYEKIEEISKLALNSIKGEVITTSSLRGFKSPLDEALFKSRMKNETLETMIEAIEGSLHKFHEYFNVKAKLLGFDKLRFYDLFAPINKESKVYNIEESKEMIFKTFNIFSKELKDYAKNAFDNNWIDLYPKPNKRGGAFCYNLHPIKESRILTNFDGSFSSIKTLAHELGHGYHGYCLKDESILNSTYSMPIAETASIFLETILKQNIIKDISKQEAFEILEMDLQASSQVVVDIYSRFLFEKEVFEKRKNSILSVKDLKEIMINSQKKSYKVLDEDYLHPYMWINKPHYYSSGLSFYNFPYTFGLLFSKGIYAEYVKGGDSFVNKYNELLKETGKNNIEDITKKIGIDVQNIDFWKSSLKVIEEDIDLFIKIANELLDKS